MAFVFRSELKDPIQAKATLPGPGFYVGQPQYNIEPSKKPFHSTLQKDEIVPKPDINPGPGSYNVAGDLLVPEKTQNIFFVPAIPEDDTVPAKATNIFKSKTKRTEYNIHAHPGPGAYHKENAIGKKNVNPYPLNLPNKLEQLQEMVKKGKKIAPSIPSNVHSYGYTENDERDLVLNVNPIMQVQQFVGPGYYEARGPSQGTKYRGPTWHKSGVKKVDTFANKTATLGVVGPGTYEAKEVVIPNYKSQPHSGFASTSLRSFDANIKQKLGYSKFQSRTPASSQSTMGRGGISGMETDDDEEDDDEYIKDATPGPGHYHNESMLSSFSLKSPSSTISGGENRFRSNKAVKPQAFGTSLRFKDHQTTTAEIGPGEYEVQDNNKKMELKYTKVPFHSSNTRFDRDNPLMHPGPGTYDPPTMLIDKVQDKSKTGYTGSFGITEKRFKISKLLEETPGPGTYIAAGAQSQVEDITTAFKKGSHYFNSKLQREPFKVRNNNNAAPGVYALDQLNIATKVAKEEDDIDLPKRYPFNTGQSRFDKPKEKPIPEDEDEDDDDEPKYGTSANLESLLKSKMKKKPNAVFQSQTKRKFNGVRDPKLPGPGAYHDANTNLWNKRTFNIHFTGD